MLTPLIAVWLAAAGAAPPAATAQTPAPEPKASAVGMFVYPQKEQDATLQQKDEGECYAWAREQTGMDPLGPPPAGATAPSPAPSGPDGSGARGAARGAAAGAIVGEAASNDAEEGAAVGAAAGAVRGRRQSKKQKAAQAEQQQQQGQAAAQANLETFKKAWGTCLDGRGYSVK